jgi:ribosome-associated protein
MDIRKLQRVIVDGLEDLKAQHIVVFNTEHLSALFERVVIASGTSNRQTKSLASNVRDAVKKAGYPNPRLEGESNGEWIIVDCGAAVVHVMQPTIRDYYHLEEIWGDKPVNMKISNATTRLVKAAEPEAPVKKAVAKKKPATKVPAKRATGTRALAKAALPKPAAKAPSTRFASPAPTRSGATKSGASAKGAAKKLTTARGGVVTRVVGVKKAAAKSQAAKNAPTKAAAKKVSARKTPARA